MNSVHRTALVTPILLSLQFANFIRTQELTDGDSLRTLEPEISESPGKSSTAYSHQLITIIILSTFQFLSLVVILVLVAITCRLYVEKRRLTPQNQMKGRVASNQYEAPPDEIRERAESLHIYANIDSVPVRTATENKGVSASNVDNKSHFSYGSSQYPTFHSPLNYEEKTATLKSFKSILDPEQVQELEEPNTYTVMCSPGKCT